MTLSVKSHCLLTALIQERLSKHRTKFDSAFRDSWSSFTFFLFWNTKGSQRICAVFRLHSSNQVKQPEEKKSFPPRDKSLYLSVRTERYFEGRSTRERIVLTILSRLWLSTMPFHLRCRKAVVKGVMEGLPCSSNWVSIWLHGVGVNTSERFREPAESPIMYGSVPAEGSSIFYWSPLTAVSVGPPTDRNFEINSFVLSFILLLQKSFELWAFFVMVECLAIVMPVND